ncbi:MAG: hypothetical protein J6Y48_08670, partial [Clostridia bacterium]|nr:hypothetical protein [Clostridia bacterium]
NAERMNRQAAYMRSAVDGIRRKLAEKAEFASDLLSALHAIAVTDLTDKRLLEEINEARAYEVQPVDHLPGRYDTDGSGYAAFYPEEGSAEEWIMNHLYTIRQEGAAGRQ